MAGDPPAHHDPAMTRTDVPASWDERSTLTTFLD